MRTKSIKKAVLLGMFSLAILALVNTTAQAALLDNLTIDSENDATIDQHINWNAGLMGIQTSWTTPPKASNYDQYAHEKLRIGRKHTGYASPCIGPRMWSVVKFDTSAIPSSEIITDYVYLRLSAIGPSSTPSDVYVLNIDWNEGTPDEDPATSPDPQPDADPVNGVSWNNFTGVDADDNDSQTLGSQTDDLILAFDNATPSNATYIGTVYPAYDNTTEIDTMFISLGLIDAVQDWIDGSRPNYGLLLRGDEETPIPVGGDGMAYYASHESDNGSMGYKPPQLIFSNQWIGKQCGDPGTVYLATDFDQNCKVDWGDFSIFAAAWLHCTDPENPACDQYWK